MAYCLYAELPANFLESPLFSTSKQLAEESVNEFWNVTAEDCSGFTSVIDRIEFMSKEMISVEFVFEFFTRQFEKEKKTEKTSFGKSLLYTLATEHKITKESPDTLKRLIDGIIEYQTFLNVDSFFPLGIDKIREYNFHSIFIIYLISNWIKCPIDDNSLMLFINRYCPNERKIILEFLTPYFKDKSNFNIIMQENFTDANFNDIPKIAVEELQNYILNDSNVADTILALDLFEKDERVEKCVCFLENEEGTCPFLLFRGRYR